MTPRDVKPLRAASCFSGIGGAECALPEADWLWCAEIEKFPSDMLATRFGHPNLGDITAPDFIDRARSFGPLDLLAGGPPCQAFSVAGLRKGMADPRGQCGSRWPALQGAGKCVGGRLRASDHATDRRLFSYAQSPRPRRK